MSFHSSDVMKGWGKILRGKVPLLSIEITRECPLRCPGCYAYNDNHLDGVLLRQLSDKRGDDLVNGVLDVIRRHDPLHVSLVGGEPLVRHRELSRILPEIARMGVHGMVVTSAVIPIPKEWMSIDKLVVAISVDGLPEHHDVRRKPATYDRILQNIEGRKVNVHWTITRPMMERPGYIEEYVRFWNGRPEVNCIWASIYTPQVGEDTPEMLLPEDRERLYRELPELAKRYPKLLGHQGLSEAFATPPATPRDCTFARMSVNYSADLATRVQPCIFGGNPDCSQCGCAISGGLHWLAAYRLGPAKLISVGDLVRASMAVGAAVNRVVHKSPKIERWTPPKLSHEERT
ncbi:MAG TPA: radical SAM protein [Clostridia bacterium]|nr:radical SAM protein [Clostridia bacterium]